MATEMTPRLKPGQTITAWASAADIEPGRFVKVTDNVNTSGQYPSGHAGAGEFAVGVSQGRAEYSFDAHAQERTCAVNTGGIVRMTAGAAVTASATAFVKSDASGRAIAHAGSGYALGIALTDAAQAGDIIEVYLFGAPIDARGTVAPSTFIAQTAAITGGEAPTEAEFNALVSKVNDIQTILIAHGLMASS